MTRHIAITCNIQQGILHKISHPTMQCKSLDLTCMYRKYLYCKHSFSNIKGIFYTKYDANIRDASIRYSVSVLAPIRSFSADRGIGETRPIQIRYCVYTILSYC